MEKEGIDSKTAWELYKKVDSFDKKLSDMKLNQDIVLKDLQSEQKKNHYEMLDAVGDSVKQYGKLMESNLTAFRFEIKSMFDDHERRLTDQEQKEMNNDLRLITVEKTTFDLPKIKETLACVDIRTANYNEIETTVAELVSAPGNKAIKRWQRLLVVAGFIGLAVFTTVEGIWINDLMIKNKTSQITNQTNN